jgi:hypothetical protein
LLFLFFFGSFHSLAHSCYNRNELISFGLDHEEEQQPGEEEKDTDRALLVFNGRKLFLGSGSSSSSSLVESDLDLLYQLEEKRISGRNFDQLFQALTSLPGSNSNNNNNNKKRVNDDDLHPNPALKYRRDSTNRLLVGSFVLSRRQSSSSEGGTPGRPGRSSGGDVAELLRVAFSESGSSGTGLLYQVEPPLDIMEEGTTTAGGGASHFYDSSDDLSVSVSLCFFYYLLLLLIPFLFLILILSL